MKLKFATYIAFFLISSMSFSQDFENDLSSVKTIDDHIIEEQYSTDKVAIVDRLVVQTPVKKRDKGFYSKREWRKIKKQLKKNKRRVSNTKNSIYTSKVLDTVYLNIPKFSEESRLSGW